MAAAAQCPLVSEKPAACAGIVKKLPASSEKTRKKIKGATKVESFLPNGEHPFTALFDKNSGIETTLCCACLIFHDQVISTPTGKFPLI